MTKYKLCVFIALLFVLCCFVMAAWRSHLDVTDRFIITGILALFSIAPFSWCFEEE